MELLIAGNRAPGQQTATAYLVNLQTGKKRLLDRRPRLEDAYVSGYFSPDGKRILLVCAQPNSPNKPDDFVRLLDRSSGTDAAPPIKLRSIKFAGFSPQGSKLLVCGQAEDPLRLFDSRSLKPVGPTFDCKAKLYAGAFDPTERIVAVVGRADSGRGYAGLFDAETGKPVGEGLKVGSVVFSLGLHTKKPVLVTGDLDGWIRFWNSRSGKQIGARQRAHFSAVRTVAFSPDGRYLLTSSEDQSANVWLWDRDADKLIRHGQPLRHTGQIHRAAFSGDGKTVLTAGFEGTVRLWRLAPSRMPGVTLFPHRGAVAAAIISRDGRTVMMGGKEVDGQDGEARLYDAAMAQRRGDPLFQRGEVTAIALTNDGKVAASVGNNKLAWLWNAQTGIPLHEPPYRHQTWLASCAFSPDGRLLSVGGGNGRVVLLDVRSGLPSGNQLEGLPGYILWAVPFSPDGNRLLTAGSDGQCRLWDVSRRKPLREMTGHSSDIRFAAFCPNARVIVTCSLDKTARLWSAHDGAPLLDRSFALPHEGEVHSAAFRSRRNECSDGISRPGPVRLWDVRAQAAPLESPCTTRRPEYAHRRLQPDRRDRLALPDATIAVSGYGTQPTEPPSARSCCTKGPITAILTSLPRWTDSHGER